MSVVMGTAGHIDHGKTSLIRRLTGVDCDRLEEEKRRGITIELGFAPLTLPEGRTLSVIDVPGHEKFVKNMVAGATGIDFVLLVVAADEGVMPQTREHLEICSLLGIRTGIVALTKIDTVDPEMIELATEDVRDFLQGTFLEDAPIFPVSSSTGQGIDKLLAALAEKEKNLSPERRTDLFRLPVDRIFTLKGHGTVVTGTLVSGSISVGEDVVVYPRKLASKVRSLQSHGSMCETAPAGRRTAVNLQGLDVESIERGDILGRPESLFPSQRWIIRMTCLSSSPRALRHRAEAHFHHGSREMQARMYFFDRDKLQPGETALCEVRFKEPYTAVFGDRVVVRSFSPLRTVAGGVVVHPLGVDMRRRSLLFGNRLDLLNRVADTFGKDSEETPKGEQSIQERRLLSILELAGSNGVSYSEMGVLTDISSKPLEKLLNLLASRQQAFCYDKESRSYLCASCVIELEEQCLAYVKNFHTKWPMKQNIGRSELASGWGKKVAPKVVHVIVEKLLKAGRLTLDGNGVRLPDHRVSLASDQTALRSKILEAHKKAGIAPPNMKDVLEALQVSQKEAAPLIKIMQDDGELEKISDAIWYETAALQSITDGIREWFKTHDDLDVAGLKELTGLSRKYLIALLEYYDRKKITIRVGDQRKLRQFS